MTVAKRFWEGIFTKGGTDIGYGNGSISIDRNLQTFYGLGDYDLQARRSTARVIECTIEHGYIDSTLFLAAATGAADSFFQIDASMAASAIKLSGCTITTHDWELPADGWINESVNLRVKTFR